MDTPTDHIIESMVATTGAYNFPLAIPFSHRFGRKVLARSVVLVVGVIAYFARREPFNSMRFSFFIIRTWVHDLPCPELRAYLCFLFFFWSVANIRTGVAFGLENLFANIASVFGVAGEDAATVAMDDNSTDFSLSLLRCTFLLLLTTTSSCASFCLLVLDTLLGRFTCK